MLKPPTLERQRIIDYCGWTMYALGKEFLKENPFFVFYREWTMLKALCEGTDSPCYVVNIFFDDSGIANSCCTCYTNRAVPCKHIAALLLLWYERPTEILERTQWLKTMQTSKKEDLVELLEKLIDLYPESDRCSQLTPES